MYFHAGAFLSFVLTIVCWPTSARGRRVAPLIEDDWARRPHRAAECTFGKQIRELGSTWYADLGPPFGIMYCIKCECIPVQKKRRIVARAQCRNIKNDCPKLNCEEPVLLPGRCCKSCPGDFSPDIVQDLPAQLTSEEEERSLKHFGTLLTGRTSQSLRRDDQTPSLLRNIAYSYVATGRFAFNRKNLYYSFYLGIETPRPRNLQFVDDAGRILEEQTIDPIGGAYQNATGKLCGVWRRVPRDYRKLLRDERLHVGLVWESSSGVLTGRLSRYRALATEQMTSLLEPAKPKVMGGSGGTAIVSASTASAPSVHVSLVFNGVFLATDVADVAISIVLEHTDKDYVVLSDEIIVKKPSNELNYGEVRSAISGADLRLLTRGKLRLTITSRTGGGLSLVGVVVPRVSCDVYQALLTSEVSSRASGLAWAYLDRQGALRYGVRLLGLQDESPLVTLVDEGGKRRTELEDLTPSLIGGFANGSLERPGPRLLEPLFKGELAVVAASHLGSLLHGRLLQRPVADAKDTAAPVLLRRLTQEAVSSAAVGLVWVAVDLDCALHYELEVTGLSPSTSSSETARTSLRLYLETMPLLVQGAPVSRRLLEEFNGNVLEGSVTGLSPVELLRIESGIGFFELTDNKSTRLLKAPFKACAPLTCLPHYADNDVASVVAYNLHPPSSADIETGACFHATRFYEEGTQWTASSDPCSMCHCYRGLAQCDPVPCPSLSCPTANRIEPPIGHCCPVCSGSVANSSDNISMDQDTTMTTKGCTLAGQFHVAGASWHPYLPPSGFDTCAVCTCDPVSLEVRCPRFECPALDCDEKTAVRPDKKACCRQCPGLLSASTGAGVSGTENVDMLPRDQAVTTTTWTTLSTTLTTTRRTPEDILSSGGCKYPMGGPYENGREWHPRVHSHGEMKCVKCRCKNGEVRCDRKRCPRSLCNSIAIQLKRGEQVSEPDDCCTAQCRRARRHHRNYHHHPPRHSVAPRELS